MLGIVPRASRTLNSISCRSELPMDGTSVDMKIKLPSNKARDPVRPPPIFSGGVSDQQVGGRPGGERTACPGPVTCTIQIFGSRDRCFFGLDYSEARGTAPR